MKNILLFICFSLFPSLVKGQETIIAADMNTCIGSNTATFSLISNDGGSPPRNIYQYTAPTLTDFQIRWNNNSVPPQWEIQVDADDNGSFETIMYGNDFNSSPNPPDLGTGTWEDLLGFCDDLTLFEGTGTQNVVLPIELNSFRVKILGQTVKLLWQTTSETNNEKFEIEYSSNGTGFKIIGEVKGQGTTLEEHNYNFVHENVEGAIAYYRLKQIDFDGNFNYSEVVSVTLAREEGSIDIFPNPSNDGLINLTIDSEEIMDINIQISDLTGKRIQSKMRAIDAGKNNLELDLSTLGKGLFIIEIEKGTQRFYERILIQ